MDSPEKQIPLPIFSWAAGGEGRSNVNFHVHDGPELIFMASGHSTIDAGDVSLEGFADDLYVLPANVPHNQTCHELTRRNFVIFHASPAWLDDSPRVVNLEGETWIPRWIEDLCGLCQTQSEPGQFAQCAQGLLMAILRRLQQIEAQRKQQRTLHPVVAASIRWTEQHLADPLTLEIISAQAGLSASHFTALFRDALGTSPMKHLQARRMVLARKLLIDPYRTISQIARRCGYGDANYFTRLFKKCHRCSPTQFRQKRSTTRVHKRRTRSPDGIPR